MVDEMESNPFDLTGDQKARLAQALTAYHQEHLPEKTGNSPLSQRERMRRYQASLSSSMQRDELVAKQFEAQMVEKRIQAWQAKIDARWYDASLDSPTLFPRVRQVIESKLKRWEVGEGLDQTSVLFAGVYGRGKTWSAYAYPAELIRLGYLSASQVYLCTEIELAAIATSGFHKGEALANLLDSKYKFFLIDDVGRGSFGTPQQRGEIWFTIINHVYSKGLTLALTTNQSVQGVEGGGPKLEDWIGVASMERLRSIVGQDGYIPFTIEMKNMREELARKSQDRFKQHQDD